MYRLVFVSFVSLLLINYLQGEELHEEEGKNGESRGQICEKRLEGADVALLFFFMLLLGIIARSALRQVPVPYTVLLLVFGLLLGLLQTRLTRPNEGHGVDFENQHVFFRKFATGIDIWQRIHPDLLELVFVPALLFSSAFSLNFHITKRSIGQVLILAGPGVIMGIVLTTLFVKQAFPYDWCWPKALLFGAMLSSTDPASVVERLKELGASKQLGTVIEAESLFNDETAFVFFSLFRDMIPVTGSCVNDAKDCRYSTHETCETGTFVPQGCTSDRSLGEFVGFFLQLALGGIAIGILVGLAATLWIRYTYNDAVTETSVTLVSVYLTFYIAEEVSEVSGVLAVVALGLFMGTFAENRISSSAHQRFQVFWEMMEYLATTFIFIFTGLKVAIELFETDSEEGNWIHRREWGYASLLYLALQLIRLIMVFSLFPGLRKMGYGMTWKDALVATWSGIRGAVGLAPAVIVDLDANNIPASFRSYTIFYLGFVVTATLLINGTTMPYLLKLLGMTKSSPEKLEFLCHLVLEIEGHGRKYAMEIEDDIVKAADRDALAKLTELDIDKIFPNKDEKKVMEAISKAPAMALEASVARLNHSQVPGETRLEMTANIETHNANDDHHQLQETRVIIAVTRDNPVTNFNTNEHLLPEREVSVDRFIRYFRKRLLRHIKRVYADQLEKGYIQATIMFDLIESADEAIDHSHMKVDDWKYLEKTAKPPQWKVKIQRCKNMFGQGSIGNRMDKLISKSLFESFSETVLLLKTFIMAHHEAEHTLHEHIKTQTNEDGAQENQSLIKMLKEAVDTVIQESKAVSEKARERLRDYRKSYPEILRAVMTRLSAIKVLLEKQSFVQDLRHTCMIERRDANLVNCQFDAKIRRLHYHSLCLHMPFPRNPLRSHAMFLPLESDIFDAQVHHIASHKTLGEQVRICSIGDHPQQVTIITQGAVKIRVGNSREEILVDGFGSVIGVAEVMLNRPMMTTVVTQMTSEVFTIRRNQFINLVNNNESVKQVAWQLTGLMLTWINPWGDFIHSNFQQLACIFRRSELRELKSQTKFRFTTKAFLIEGRVLEEEFDQSKTNVIKAPAPLVSRLGKYCSQAEVKILLMPMQMTVRSSLAREIYEQRRRMLAMTFTSMDQISGPMLCAGIDSHSHEASTSTSLQRLEDDAGLQGSPQDASVLVHSRSDEVHSRRRRSVELQLNI